MATLRVTLSKPGQPCVQDETPAGVFPHPGWYAFVNTCDGQPLVYAGKEYGPFPVDHGYVEIKNVPPGTYYVWALVNPFPVATKGPYADVIYQSNFVAHFSIIEVCCNDCPEDICVRLYNSGWHYCATVIIHWFATLAARGQIDPELAETVHTTLTRAMVKGDALPADAPMIQQIQQLAEMFHRQKRADR
ncbi:MAG: hypothetical protein JO036_01940 [Candidatus Eremiobacteraeota bacterium]|nr:hypothetical protein [Candidatus Eremiobacteraeota bacterium]